MGGAEKLLLSVLDKHDGNKFDLAVCGFYKPQRESIYEKFKEIGVKCYDLRIEGGKSFLLDPIGAISRTIRIITKFKKIVKIFQPDIIHTHLFCV